MIPCDGPIVLADFAKAFLPVEILGSGCHGEPSIHLEFPKPFFSLDMLMDRFGDDFISLLDLCLTSNDFTVFAILLPD